MTRRSIPARAARACIPDCLRRALGLPTAPPPCRSPSCGRARWLGEIVAVGEAGCRRVGWAEAAALHPVTEVLAPERPITHDELVPAAATLATVVGWGDVRANVASGHWSVPDLSPERGRVDGQRHVLAMDPRWPHHHSTSSSSGPPPAPARGRWPDPRRLGRRRWWLERWPAVSGRSGRDYMGSLAGARSGCGGRPTTFGGPRAGWPPLLIRVRARSAGAVGFGWLGMCFARCGRRSVGWFRDAVVVDVGEAASVLGVGVGAPWAEVRGSYRRLMRATHPDVAGPDGSRRAARITEAYALLRQQRCCAAPPSVPPIDADLVDGETIAILAPPDEAFALLLEAAHDTFDVSYVDRSTGIIEAIVTAGPGGQVSSLLMTLQGAGHRRDGGVLHDGGIGHRPDAADRSGDRSPARPPPSADCPPVSR